MQVIYVWGIKKMQETKWSIRLFKDYNNVSFEYRMMEALSNSSTVIAQFSLGKQR